MNNQVLGIDFGGSGIKAAIVDIVSGKLISERHRFPTPQPATPKACSRVFKELIEHFNWNGPIGCGFPGLIKKGVVVSAANLDKKWKGIELERYLKEQTSHEIKVLNDADAAGLAESLFGGGKDTKGLTFLLTIGTGIGSAIIMDGLLIPNTELGHIFMKNGKEAERFTSDLVRKNEDLSWDVWGRRFNKYLKYLETLFSPDLFIIGGGASKKFDKFQDQISIETKIVPAELLNLAGIIGAAASHKSK